MTAAGLPMTAHEDAPREMTEAECDLAQEVHAHNEKANERHLGEVLALRALGLDVPGLERTDADGRWIYDRGALDARIALLGREESKDLVARAVSLSGTPGLDMLDLELKLRTRHEAAVTGELRADLAEMDDREAVEAILAEAAEARDEVEGLGRHWWADAFNVISHDGLSARVAACEERLAELAPSPSP